MRKKNVTYILAYTTISRINGHLNAATRSLPQQMSTYTENSAVFRYTTLSDGQGVALRRPITCVSVQPESTSHSNPAAAPLLECPSHCKFSPYTPTSHLLQGTTLVQPIICRVRPTQPITVGTLHPLPAHAKLSILLDNPSPAKHECRAANQMPVLQTSIKHIDDSEFVQPLCNVHITRRMAVDECAETNRHINEGNQKKSSCWSRDSHPLWPGSSVRLLLRKDDQSSAFRVHASRTQRLVRKSVSRVTSMFNSISSSS